MASFREAFGDLALLELVSSTDLRFDYAFGAGSSLFMDEISSLDDEDLQGRSYDGEEGRDLGEVVSVR